MKTLLKTILLFVIIWQGIGISILYQVNLQSIKQESKMQMGERKKELILIELNRKEFQSLLWIKQKREFVFNGQFYDVASIKKSPKGYLLRVYADNKETAFASSTDYQSSDDQSSVSFEIIEEIIDNLMAVPIEIGFNPVFIRTERQKNTFSYSFILKEFNENTLSPPPNFFLPMCCS